MSRTLPARASPSYARKSMVVAAAPYFLGTANPSIESSMPTLRRPDMASWELPRDWVLALMEREGLPELRARSLVRCLLLFHWSACKQFGEEDCKRRYLPCPWHPKGIVLYEGRIHVPLSQIVRATDHDFLLKRNGKVIRVQKSQAHDYRHGCDCPSQIAACRHEIALQKIGPLGMFTMMLLATGIAIGKNEADEWLKKLEPQAYCDPELEPGDGADRTTPEKELLTFIDRAGIVEPAGWPIYALRHPRDILCTDACADVLGEQAELGKVRGEIVPAWEKALDEEWDEQWGEETPEGRDKYERQVLGEWRLLTHAHKLTGRGNETITREGNGQDG